MLNTQCSMVRCRDDRSCLERNARLEEERRRSEEQEEQERRKTFQEGKKGSTMELIAGVVSPTIEGMGLDKVGK